MLRSFLTDDDTTSSFLFLSLLLFFLFFLYLCLCFFLNRPVYSFYFLRCPHSILPEAGCSFRRMAHRWSFSATVKWKETRYEESSNPNVHDVSLYCDCFFLYFFVCYETHARANFVLSPTPCRPLVTVSLNLDTYDSLCFPVSPFLPHILALTSPNRTLSFSFSPSLSLCSFLATFIHFDKGRDVSFKTMPYTRPASALIDYDAYCIEKGCPPVDSRKGFPAWTVRRSLCSPSPRQENPRESVHGCRKYMCVGACGSRVTYTSVTPTSMLGGW